MQLSLVLLFEYDFFFKWFCIGCDMTLLYIWDLTTIQSLMIQL